MLDDRKTTAKTIDVAGASSGVTRASNQSSGKLRRVMRHDKSFPRVKRDDWSAGWRRLEGRCGDRPLARSEKTNVYSTPPPMPPPPPRGALALQLRRPHLDQIKAHDRIARISSSGGPRDNEVQKKREREREGLTRKQKAETFEKMWFEKMWV